MRRLAAGLAAALCLATAPASAQLAADLDAALAAPEGGVVAFEAWADPDDAVIPVRPAGGARAVTARYEGGVLRRAWRVEGPDGTLATARELEARLEALGFAPVLRCEEASCGGFAFRNAIEVFEHPAMAVNLADFRQLTMEGETGSGPALVSVLLSRIAGVTLAQIVAVQGAEAAPPVAPSAPPDPVAPPPTPSEPPPEPSPETSADARPATPEPPAPADATAPPDAAPAGLIARLRRDGRAVLEGVDFVPGSTALAGSAAPVIDAAAAALAAAPDIAVMVVGHTDDSGSLDVNLRVSRARAESVADALRARGVAADRLSAAGAAFLAPRASNADEAGRALNRRVELVLR